MKKIYLLTAIPFLFTACNNPVTYDDIKTQAIKAGFSMHCIDYAVPKVLASEAVIVAAIVRLENCRTRELIQALK